MYSAHVNNASVNNANVINPSRNSAAAASPTTVDTAPPKSASDQSWSAALETVLNQPASALPAQITLVGLAFTGVMGAWAWYGRMDEVASAQGKLIPKGRTAAVQPIEMGKVASIAVKEGDVVKKGQVLMEMDTALADREVERLQSLLQSQQMEWNQSEAMMRQLRMQGENRVVIAQSQISTHQVAIRQLAQNTQNQAILIAQLREDAQAQRGRFDRLQPLAEVGAISREQVFGIEQQLRERMRSLTDSQGKLQSTQTEMQRLNVEMQEKVAAVRQAELSINRELQEMQLRMTEIRSKMKETQILLAAAQTKRQQRFIYAPVQGTVLAMNVHQQGAVVQPGEMLAEIAPEGEPLILSTMLPSQQAGFVKVGMPVRVKLDAYPYQDFGIVDGKVLAISPNSQVSEKMGQVYRVDIALDRRAVKAYGKTVAFKPGQTASAEIVTRRRRIADVLLEPLQKLRGDMTSGK
jgi:hemolysin D